MTCILLLIGRMTCILLLMGRMTCILLLIGRVKEKEYRVCVYYRGDETGTEALEFVDMIRAVRVLLLEQNKKSVKRDLEVLKETHDLLAIGLAQLCDVTFLLSGHRIFHLLHLVTQKLVRVRNTCVSVCRVSRSLLTLLGLF